MKNPSLPAGNSSLQQQTATAIGTACQLAQQQMNRRVVDAQENLGSLTVDPMRLRQIVLNLLSNTSKFTKEGEFKLGAHKVANVATGSSCRSPTPASA
jgi:signal transduction histidine kinase